MRPRARNGLQAQNDATTDLRGRVPNNKEERQDGLGLLRAGAATQCNSGMTRGRRPMRQREVSPRGDASGFNCAAAHGKRFDRREASYLTHAHYASVPPCLAKV